MQPINYSAMQVQSNPYGAYSAAKQQKTTEEMAMRRLGNQERAAASQENARVAATEQGAQRITLERERMDAAAGRAKTADAIAQANLETSQKRLGMDRERLDADLAREERAQELLKKQETEAKQMRADMIEFAQKPNQTPRDFQALVAKYPKMAKEMRASFDQASKDGQKQMATEASQIYAALQGGHVDIAKGLVEGRLEAYQNSGNEAGAAGAEAMLKIMERDPDAAKVSAGLYLASVTDGSKLAYTMGALERMQPGNTPGDIAELADYGRELELKKSQINKVMAKTRGKSAAERREALQIEAGVDIDDAAKHRREFEKQADAVSRKNKQSPSVDVSAVPAAAIEYLKSNPQFKAEFNAKYGKGAAERVLK